MTELVTRFRGLIDEWDVTNETAGNREYMDLLGAQEMIAWYQLARQADPKLKLAFTEPRYDSEGGEGGSFPVQQLPGYRGWVDYLVRNGAPLDVLGSQEHGGSMVGRLSPEMVWKHWDTWSGRYGKQLVLSELDVNIENDQDAEQLRYQADMLRDSVIVAFAHPAITGVNQWGFWERAHWFPKAALYRADWTIKPNGQAYLDLIHRRWHTNEQRTTSADGEVAIRGFCGKYSVTITQGGKTATRSLSLGKEGAQAKIELK